MTRNTPYQLAAGLCVLLAVYPVWAWYGAWVHWPDWTAFAMTGGSLAVGVLAWIHRRVGFPLERRSLLLAGTLARLAALLLGAAGWAVSRSLLTGAGAIVLGAIVFAVYLVAWEMYRLPTESLLSVYAFILMCSAYFVGILLCILMGSTSFKAAGFLMLCATAGVFVLLRSLFRLLRTAEGRDTPRGFYGYNAVLLGGFLVLGSLLTAVGSRTFNGIFRAAAAVGRFLQRIAQFVTGLMFSDQLLRLDDDDSSGGASSGMAPLWIGYTIEAVTILLVLFLLWRFRREFADFLAQIFAGAVRAVRRLLALKAPEPVPEIHPEYTDSVELLDAQPAVRRQHQRDPLREARRRWRKATDPREKYRAGYALWLMEVRRRGAEFPPSAVPDRILEAASGIPDPTLTGRMTKVYYRVRYGEYVPDSAELAELGRILKYFRQG